MNAAVPGILLARAALSRLIEPSDTVGQALVMAVGPEAAARIASGRQMPGAADRRGLSALLEENGIRGSEQTLNEALGRWRPRAAGLAPERDLATVSRFGGTLLVPEDHRWPGALDELGLGTPFCLWTRGGTAIPPAAQCVAVVGSRDATAYGLSVTGDLAAGLVQRGRTVISGGAYGIDAQAHRSALAVSGREPEPGEPAQIPTLAVLAGGIDRFYPAGNEDLLRAVVDRGLILSEVPPGSAPTRWRFLQRNRLIAALSAATIVVEARWRSGALNTAHHAAGLGRGVGAVPGPVYSANSAGCHRLLRDGSAVCVTDAAEVVELSDPLGLPSAEPAGPGAGPIENRPDKRADHDGLAVEDILLLDALPLRTGSPVEKLAMVAGLGLPAVRAGLARLELEGLARRSNTGAWQRARRSGPGR
ncbi:DNA-protecting protein DprA [Arthrobacter sp. Sa2BUA2]|uniref:DNA-protecting protein DprA n=1 Tax=Arthrobacter pullicola TaxID=2762224 RepID=A0ABR8YM08_9MICC|nr:DNA-processing protein DprA [Arthrobacter pullicola]MBD8045277.1 DNA-protecting protein DprA [Arthrobacter pullicola]